MTCAPSVSRCWEFVCFEECEKRWAWGYLTRLRLEHPFQLLCLGCKWPVFTFSFSIKSSCSSLCLSNTALASWKEICGREEEPAGLPGRCQRGGWETAGMAAAVWELSVLAASHPCSHCVGVPGTASLGSLLCPGAQGRRCLVQHTQGLSQIQPQPPDSFFQGCSCQQGRWVSSCYNPEITLQLYSFFPL